MVKVNASLMRVSSAKEANQLGDGSEGKGLNIDLEEQKKLWGLEGKNKSGRPHKSRKAKFSSTMASKQVRVPFEQRMMKKKLINDLKSTEKEMIDERVSAKRKHREALKVKEAQKRENEIKSSSFQNISSEKVKKLGKKALRMIHKVDFDQIRDARIGVGMRTAFGGIKERGSGGKIRR
eukprot:TRINITY_DN11682_c0_g1_i2.p1 TRINITY_DN11682_c0_g1~~TRINITY_DN11682_c0_g1_i2.p1  ORF type:complete len:179 (-),score=56.51 TRINITY_DN11682_c0_g1_i2:192-728(-)